MRLARGTQEQGRKKEDVIAPHLRYEKLSLHMYNKIISYIYI